ncbi:MAG: helix-turn-helix domain-containing protein [Planctomycetota bacterium]|jgi:transcriptional regulator with XRE-family HTH domain
MSGRKVSPADQKIALQAAAVIGARVRKLRQEQGYTTSSLARKLRISQAQVSRLENGLQAFRSKRVLQIARVLGVTPTFLIAGPDGENKTAVTRELETYGLVPSSTLRSALRDPGFLRFAEGCARSMKKHKKNLVRMTKAVKGATGVSQT